jgi:hypothetical protein
LIDLSINIFSASRPPCPDGEKKNNSLVNLTFFGSWLLFQLQDSGYQERRIMMADIKGEEVAGLVRQKMGEFLDLCKDLPEATASQAPSGRWSPKQIVSHISGPDGTGYLPGLQSFLDEETPRMDIEPENPYFTDRRAGLTFAALVAEFQKEYSRIADFAAGLSPAQLKRKAHVPLLKETPLGEHPTLAEWIGALVDYHVGFHIDHLKEIRGGLGL